MIGERRTTINHAMKSCRRAWNIVARRHPGKLPHVNPFAQMGLRSSERETPTGPTRNYRYSAPRRSRWACHRWQPAR